MNIRKDADQIIRESIGKVLPDEAVSRALAGKQFGAGKMDAGVVVTKYGHVKAEIPGMKCFEAGHPVPDQNSFIGTQAALEAVEGLTAEDTVLFLLSGG